MATPNPNGPNPHLVLPTWVLHPSIATNVRLPTPASHHNAILFQQQHHPAAANFSEQPIPTPPPDLASQPILPPLQQDPIRFPVPPPGYILDARSIRSVYTLPPDVYTYTRIDRQHAIHVRNIDGLYYPKELVARVLAPQPGVIKRVLDLAPTASYLSAGGGGNWLIDMALEFTHVQFTGIDLSPSPAPLQPAYNKRIPPNCRFEHADYRQEMPQYHGQFDVVHARTIANGVANYPVLIEEMARCLKPGGVILLADGDMQLVDHNLEPQDMALDDEECSQAPEYCWLSRIFFEGYNILKRRGASMDAGMMLEPWLRKCAAFEKVNMAKVYTPIGPWKTSCNPQENAKWNYTGSIQRDNMWEFAQALRPLLLQEGYAPATISDWMRKIAVELKTFSVRLHVRWYYAWAIKRENYVDPPWRDFVTTSEDDEIEDVEERYEDEDEQTEEDYDEECAQTEGSYADYVSDIGTESPASRGRSPSRSPPPLSSRASSPECTLTEEDMEAVDGDDEESEDEYFEVEPRGRPTRTRRKSVEAPQTTYFASIGGNVADAEGSSYVHPRHRGLLLQGRSPGVDAAVISSPLQPQLSGHAVPVPGTAEATPGPATTTQPHANYPYVRHPYSQPGPSYSAHQLQCHDQLPIPRPSVPYSSQSASPPRRTYISNGTFDGSPLEEPVSPSPSYTRPVAPAPSNSSASAGNDKSTSGAGSSTSRLTSTGPNPHAHLARHLGSWPNPLSFAPTSNWRPDPEAVEAAELRARLEHIRLTGEEETALRPENWRGPRGYRRPIVPTAQAGSRGLYEGREGRVQRP
ncbi:hypothetical protein FRB99_005920 [Tulasnella sp. 403]|nr:hypothetical protein FRB99_005920 [Tulasnella sp. 403]